jgi:RimJ/RimL family protein N-acetyltransferase
MTPEGMPDLPRLRRATEADAELLLEWRNDPDTRSASFEQQPIGIEEHRAWLGRRLADPDCVLLVVELDGTPSGSMRLDRDEPDTAEAGRSVSGRCGRRRSGPRRCSA